MELSPTILPLGIALLMGAATFIAVNPPPAFRVIRYDEIVVPVQADHFKYDDPCAGYAGTNTRYLSCRKARQRRAPKPSTRIPYKQPYKMADPFWDWG